MDGARLTAHRQPPGRLLRLGAALSRIGCHRPGAGPTGTGNAAGGRPRCNARTRRHPSSTEQLALEEGFVRPDDRYEADKQAANYYRDPNALRVFFRQGSTAIDTTYMENAATLKRLNKALHVMTADTAIRITRLVVVGYASIEGALQHNTHLAGERAGRLRKYAAVRGVPLSGIEIINMGEGWDELRDMVANSENVPYRKEMLRIIDTVPVLRGREKRLMNLRGGVPYRWMMKHFFPPATQCGLCEDIFQEELIIYFYSLI